MRTPVICKNCGLKWLRVISWGSNLELIDDLQYYCPKCSSNWCEEITDTNIKKVGDNNV